jgi:hypothetical protein
MWVIGIRNLVVEMDARYIKGMLAHPDILPSASINRWILSILTFHFTLVHVKGTFHRPDGLSRRPTQPDDRPVEDEDEEWDDYIDRLHGFMHVIQDLPYQSSRIFARAQILSMEEETIETQETMEKNSYEMIPRNKKGEKEDRKLEEVRIWHDTLQRPDNFSDSEYASFMRYAMGFFLDGIDYGKRIAMGLIS